MRHRQTTGAGASGARPGIVVFALTVAGGGLAAGIEQPAGAWAGYGAASLAAVVGFSTLWQQRGLLERRAQEAAKRRRADLEAAAVAALRHRTEIERARADLEHEQQYSALIQGQLARAREQLERERVARRAAERELDALTGAGTWRSDLPTVLLTVEEPHRAAVARGVEAGVVGVDGAAEPDQVRPGQAEPTPMVAPVSAVLPAPAVEPVPATELAPAAEASAVYGPDAVTQLTRPEPATPEAAPVDRVPAPRSAASAAAQRRGWQIVDGDDEDDELSAAETDRLYRPFIDRLDPAPAAAPVSDAALAMAPVIATELDGMLDLTAYDETIEFSVREIKGMA